MTPDRATTPDHATTPPTLPALFRVFLVIGMQSFGGGLSAWMRRETVQKHRWLEEGAFLSGLALCQITPGPNAVNLAVFIGTTLRGRPGAVAALGGMLLVPVFLVLAMGAAFARLHDSPGLQSAMAGLGCGAIGLNLATGLRMLRKNIRTPAAILITAAAALGVGILGANLLLSLLVMIPASLLLARMSAR